MKASKLLEQLQKAIQIHGDREIFICTDGECDLTKIVIMIGESPSTTHTEMVFFLEPFYEKEYDNESD